MAKTLSTNSLIKSIRRRAMLPSTQSTFKEEDFLAFANEEMDNAVVPYVQSFREDYFIASQLITLDADKTSYRIPDRATGNKLRDVRFKDQSNNIYEMTRIFIEDEPYFQYNSAGSGPTTLRTFMVKNDEIVFPYGVIPASISYMEAIYYIRPNEIVSEDNVAVIKSINTTNNTVTIDKFPEVFNGASIFDITSCKSPFKLLAIEIQPTVIATADSLVFQFETLPRYLSVGDVIALPEQTSIPQVPLEVHSLLAQRVAMRCLEALGDTQGLQNAAAKLAEMEDKLGSLLDDRVEGAPKKVVNFHSFLRNSRKWNRR